MLAKVIINLLILCLLFIDTEYQILFSAIKKTCSEKYKVEYIQDGDEAKCKRICNENNTCNFVFLTVQNRCIL